jgi:hypothetical protein
MTRNGGSRPAPWQGATSSHRWFNQRWRSFLRYWIALSSRPGSIGFCASSLPLRFRFVSLIQVYALHRNGGDSRGGSEIKLVPAKVD